MINKSKHIAAYSKIVGLLFSKQASLLHVRAIARALHQNAAVTSKLINELLSEGLVKYTNSGRSKIVKFNPSSPFLSSLLMLNENYKKIEFMDENENILEFIRLSEKLESIKIMIIFGSYAKGTQTKNSDLDVMVVTDEKAAVELPSYVLPIKLHKIQLKYSAFLEALFEHRALLKEIIENHIIIKGQEIFIEKILENYGK